MFRLTIVCLLAVALSLPATATAGHYTSVSVQAFPVNAASCQNAALAAAMQQQYLQQQQFALQQQQQYLQQQQAAADAAYQMQQQRFAAPAPVYQSSGCAASFRPQRLLVPTTPYAAIGVSSYSSGVSRFRGPGRGY